MLRRVMALIRRAGSGFGFLSFGLASGFAAAGALDGFIDIEPLVYPAIAAVAITGFFVLTGDR